MASPPNQGNLPWSNSQPLFGAPGEPWHSQPPSQSQSQSQFTHPGAIASGSQSFPVGSYSTASSTAGTSYDATQHFNFGFSPPLLPGSFESMPSSFGSGSQQGFGSPTQLQGGSQGGFSMPQSHSQGFAQPMAPPPPAPAPAPVAPWLAVAPAIPPAAPAAAQAPAAPLASLSSTPATSTAPGKKPRKTNPNPKPRKKANEGTPGVVKERKKPGPKPRAKKSASARGESVAGATDRRSRSASQSVAPGARGSVVPGQRGATAVAGEGVANGTAATAAGAGEEEEDGDSEEEEDEDEALEDDELERQETIERERNERLGALMRAMTEEQYDRHESYRRGGLNKLTVKKLVNHVLSQSVSTPVALLFAGAGKVFIGEIVESARKIAAARPGYNPRAPLTPDDLREAYMAYKNEREKPGLYAPGAPSAGAGAAGTGKRKRLF